MKRPARPGTGTPAPVEAPAEVHSLETERAVLGAALVSAHAADYVADHLCAESFYRQAHQRLFTAVQTLRHQGVEVDLVTLKQQLGTAVDQVGGPAYIASLTDGVPKQSNAPHYAAILEDLRAKRALSRFGRAVVESVAGNGQSSRSLIENADRQLLELQGGHLNGRLASLSDTVPQLLEDLEYRSQHRGLLLGLDTGFPGVNDITFGWQKGDLDVIGARPSIGKTTFVLNTARAVAGAGGRVVIFSYEMRRAQLEYRLLASASGIHLTKLLTGYLGDGDWPALQEATHEFQDLKIEIDDCSTRTVGEMRSTCRRLKADGGLDLAIVDYLQLVPGTLDRRGATRTEELTDITRRLKMLADEGGFPLIALSQLSRPTSGQADPRPKLTDLRESGSIEQDADLVCFLHRKHHKEGGPTEFIVEKARNGPTGTVMLTLNRDITTFTDGGDLLPEPTPDEKQAAKKTRQQSFMKQRARSR